eukprot:GDKI01000255.1.p1 GENE.GDKI01000255.1~~GDKI01000255.1.p1  ORF type:complete len:191 (-),score=27.61 GDKI01000255.1:19-591(-)
MLEYLGFKEPSPPVDFAALGRFSKEHSNRDFEISNGGVRVCRKTMMAEHTTPSNQNVCAVVGESVGRGFVCTWRLGKIGGGWLGFGFIDGSQPDVSGDDDDVNFFRLVGFDFCGKITPLCDSNFVGGRGKWEPHMRDGDIFEIRLDTRNANTPTMSHSPYKLPLPTVWERVTLVCRLSFLREGVEILSVD